ncbi:MAG: YmdB family metallophosphoesterase [Verrucomicrobia bacterium]|nr:YmdB family metallophosphoesterase [Verrucomicrobiota bacterium]
MKLLFIGDIVGEPGRRAIKQLVPRLRRELRLDAVIANGENAAGGSGITPNTATEIFDAGVDLITTGDHLWDQKDVSALLQHEPRFLRPLNYPPGTIGQGSAVFTIQSPESKVQSPMSEIRRADATSQASEAGGRGRAAVAVLNLQGRTFMAPLENPFLLAAAEVARLRARTRCILVDFHAEATSEKIALARMLDGQVSAVIGTHTHVQTADEQIFPGGTAFLCDAGFTGAHESILGREIEPIIKRFLTNTPQRFEVAKHRVLLQGALLELDDAAGRAVSIRRVSEALVTDGN